MIWLKNNINNVRYKMESVSRLYKTANKAARGKIEHNAVLNKLRNPTHCLIHITPLLLSLIMTPAVNSISIVPVFANRQ